MEKEILDRLSALSHTQRMAVFRLLVRRYPDALPAGQIAEVLDIRASTLSVYLSVLKAAGLIRQNRKGTSLLYSAQISAVQGVLDYLLMDCCKGRPDLCGAAPGRLPSTRKLNALFICSANSARSIFAEALLRDTAGDRFNVHSAGIRAGNGVNPNAIAVLQERGHETSKLQSQGLDLYQADGAPEMDFVITVCDQAANEDCPAWPGQPISAHWSIPDPVRTGGSQVERTQAFQAAYTMLQTRIRAFGHLPFDTLDRASLQLKLDDILEPEGTL